MKGHFFVQGSILKDIFQDNRTDPVEKLVGQLFLKVTSRKRTITRCLGHLKK